MYLFPVDGRQTSRLLAALLRFLDFQSLDSERLMILFCTRGEVMGFQPSGSYSLWPEKCAKDFRYFYSWCEPL